MRRLLSGLCIALLLAGTTLADDSKMFRKNVDETDQRITGVESGVESNERRIDDLASETDSKIASVRQTADRAVELGNQASTQAKQAQEINPNIPDDFAAVIAKAMSVDKTKRYQSMDELTEALDQIRV